MSEYNLLNTKRNQYINNKTKLINISNLLLKSIEAVEKIMQNNTTYLIEESPADNKYIEQIYEKEKNIYNEIQNNILPNINNKINKLYYQMIDAKQQEELERK